MAKSDVDRRVSAEELAMLREDSQALRLLVQGSQETGYHIWVDSRIEPTDPHWTAVRRAISEGVKRG